jgi:peptidoglycan/LPS O-acetylase OafA/YrhL
MVVVTSGILGAAYGNWLALGPVMDGVQTNGSPGIVLTSLSNLTVFFQDWVMFFKQDLGRPLEFTSNFSESSYPLWRYLLLPQCWSVGIELCFYLIAPFVILRLSTKQVLVMIAASLAARVCAYQQFGLAHDPWTYRFFPFEITLFAFGILAGRLYLGRMRFERVSDFSARAEKKSGSVFYGSYAALLLIAMVLHSSTIAYLQRALAAEVPNGAEFALILSYAFWILLIPALFALTRGSRLDRAIGELSYPVYLVHYTVIMVVLFAVARIGIRAGLVGEVSAVISILVSIGLMRFIIEPFEHWRQRLISLMGGAHQKGESPLNYPGVGNARRCEQIS